MTFPFHINLSQRHRAEGSSSIIMDERVPSRLTISLFVLKKREEKVVGTVLIQLSMVYDAACVLERCKQELLSLSWGYCAIKKHSVFYCVAYRFTEKGRDYNRTMTDFT
jgi:hypothetical protein